MIIFLKLLCLAWFLWAGLVLAATLTAQRIFTDEPAYVTGIWWAQTIYIHPDAHLTLDPYELQAIMYHEEGHIHHKHILENTVVAIFLPFVIPFRRERMIEQEIEADDFAANKIGGAAGYCALASAISKLAKSPFDRFRADRCARIAMQIHAG